MAAPTFVKKTIGTKTGAGPHTLSYASATTSGNLLTLAVNAPGGKTVNTPSGWTATDISDEAAQLPSSGGSLWVFYRESNGLTNVTLTVGSSFDLTYILAEHAGITNPIVYGTPHYYRVYPGPGYIILPATPYPAGVAAILGWSIQPGPEPPSTMSGSGTGVTLRTPNTYSDAYKNLALSDILRDGSAGTTVQYPTSGGWRHLFTHNARQMGVTLVFVSAGGDVEADFIADPESGPAPLEVQFTQVCAGEPDTFAWDFGDGDTSTDENPIHTFTAPGSYDVELVATRSGDMDSDSVTKIAFVISIERKAGVFVDFEDDGFDAGAHDDIRADGNVMSWSISRGAGAEITGGSQPGSATVVIKNPDDMYNPRNEASDLAGLLRDGLPIWIGVGADGSLTDETVHGLFGGRVTDITLIPAGGAEESPTVELVCEDALGWYRRLPVVVDYAEGRAHDALREAALIAADETRYDLAHEIHTMPLSHAEGDLLSTLDAINSVNGTRHYARPEDFYQDWYTYTTRNRQYGLAGAAAASLDAGSDHVTGTSGWRLSADTVINQQRATVTPIKFTPATFTVWEADQLPISVTDDRPYTRIVSFDDVVSGATLDIASTGDTVTSTLEPFATGAKITLTVGAGDEASVSRLSIEGRLARRLESASAVADDTTSQGAPRGIRAGSEIGNEYLGVLASASGIAEHVVWRYGNPQLRPTLTVENWFPEMFDLDLYDVIAFSSTQLGMTDQLFEIVGLTLDGRIAADNVQHHVATYVLQECKVQAPYDWFYLDGGPNSSVLDDATFHLAY